MTDSSEPRADRLTPLQRDLARAFFDVAPPGWFLTGGAALAGWWLGHRTTQDLDLFAERGELADGDRALRAAAARLGATVTLLTRTTDFARALVTRPGEEVLVDLVRDRVPALEAKVVIDGVRLDSPREIAANKLNALADRAEPRDLVDLRALLASRSLDDVLADGARKSLACEPATLAWILSTSPWSAAAVPEGHDPAEVAAFRTWLEAELRRRAAPR